MAVLGFETHAESKLADGVWTAQTWAHQTAQYSLDKDPHRCLMFKDGQRRIKCILDIIWYTAHGSAANLHSTCWIPLDLQYEARRAGSVECAARSECEWVRRCLSKCLCVFRERERVCLAQLHSPRLHSVTCGHTHHIHKDTQAENCSVTTLSWQAYVIQHLDAVKNKTPINMHRNTLHRLSTVICSNLVHVVIIFSLKTLSLLQLIYFTDSFRRYILILATLSPLLFEHNKTKCLQSPVVLDTSLNSRKLNGDTTFCCRYNQTTNGVKCFWSYVWCQSRHVFLSFFFYLVLC